MKPSAALVLALVSTALVACRSTVPLEVRIEIPGVAAIPAGSFDEIVVADFEEAAPLPDLAAGRELRDHLVAGIRRSFRGSVVTAGSADEALSRPKERALVIAGSVRLVGEVRKALDRTRVPLDGPFKTAGRGLVELRHWTLAVDLAVRSAADGAILFRRAFREERDYIDLDKPADFAFAELADRVRARLLPLLLGTATLESRSLLGR